MRALLLFLAAVVVHTPCRPQNSPIGTWTDHLPYGQAIAVARGNDRIWCATPYGIFSIDANNEFSRLSKLNGLSESGLRTMAYNAMEQALVIGYENGNLDVVRQSSVTNLNAIKNSGNSAAQSINTIYCLGSSAYLATGLGIVVLNVTRNEIANTYIIGRTGNEVNTFAVGSDNTFLYAGTEEGLLQTPLQGGNPSDYREWTLLNGTGGLPEGPVTHIALIGNQLAVAIRDTIYLQNNPGTWIKFYSGGLPISQLAGSGNQLLISELGPPAARITVVDGSGAIREQWSGPLLQSPAGALVSGSDTWIADRQSGLLKFDGNNFIPYRPNSPAAPALGPLLVTGGALWAASGALDPSGQPAGNRNGLYEFDGNNWTNFNRNNNSLFDSLPDFVALEADPESGAVWAGSYGGGLLHIDPAGQMTLFKSMSGLQPPYHVAGISYDAGGNLWISNAGAAMPLVLRKRDGSWQQFVVPYPIAGNATGTIISDDLGQQWIIGRNGQGLICYNHGASPESIGDDNWKWYRSGQGNGNLPDDQVNCLARDKNNFIWVGTNRGIGIIQCPQSVFSPGGCEAVLPVVQQDNFAGYLFRDEIVQAIAVDGANRKWIGTQNGVWLISADAEKTIYRFTTANSPLISNNVLHIAVNGANGDVYFATPQGICAFRSTATEGQAKNSNLLVFPNPVPPDYQGAIAIRGLVNNAYVKIIEPNGRLVFETRALGGQAVWNGLNYRGQRVATGVYLVLVRDESRIEKTVAKIVFIGK